MEVETSTTRVPVNVYRTEELLMVAAAMPGLQPNDVTIEVSEQGRLLLRGDLRGKLKDTKEVLVEEWQAGGYRRELDLPVHVDAANGRATYENGVLVVVLPIGSSVVPGSFSPHAGQGH